MRIECHIAQTADVQILRAVCPTEDIHPWNHGIEVQPTCSRITQMGGLLLDGGSNARCVGDFARSAIERVAVLVRVGHFDTEFSRAVVLVNEGSADRQIRILSARSLPVGHRGPKQQR